MCELSILPMGSRWVLFDDYASEVGRYASEEAALLAARSYLEEEQTASAAGTEEPESDE